MATAWPGRITHGWKTKVALAIGVSLLVILLTQESILKLGIVQRMELASIDYRFESRGTNPAFKDSASVVIVEISEESFKSLPAKWPWPRSYYARALRNLRAAGARVVGLDLIFGGNDVYSLANDDSLREAIRETRIAVLAGKTEVLQDTYIHTTSTENFGNIFFDVDSTIGLVNIRNDADGVYRRYSPFFATNTGLRIPTFGFAILNKYFGFPALTTAENSSTEFIFADREIPKYDPGTLPINFLGPDRTFRRIKFVDVVDDESCTTNEEKETGEEINTFSDPDYGLLHDSTFAGKIVLIGSTVPEDHDLFPVAFARGQQEGDNLMYGVEIHANLIESVLRDQFITKQSVYIEIAVITFLTILTFLVTSALKSSTTKHHVMVEVNGFLFATAEVFIVGYLALVMFNKYSYLVSVVAPGLAVVAGYVASTTYHFVVERKQRMLIKAMFSTYVHPSVVDELIAHPEKLKLGGERKELTVLFSDIEGFTTISEGMPPEELVGLLNEYLSKMTEIVFQHHGTLDKYEGDAVMAFWGAPIPQGDHALRSCVAALHMQRAVRELHTQWQDLRSISLSVRIGINSGEMVVGNLGAVGKFDYTVIGDSVNLASRLEGANKIYGTGILVSERTHELVKERILAREIDLVAVKGRSGALRVYELICDRTADNVTEQEKKIEQFHRALELYRNRAWVPALKAFEEIREKYPQDQTTALYIPRSAHYASQPPPPDWNGVFVMETK